MNRFFAKNVTAEQAKALCLLCGVFVTFHDNGDVSFLGLEMGISICHSMLKDREGCEPTEIDEGYTE